VVRANTVFQVSVVWHTPGKFRRCLETGLYMVVPTYCWFVYHNPGLCVFWLVILTKIDISWFFAYTRYLDHLYLITYRSSSIPDSHLSSYTITYTSSSIPVDIYPSIYFIAYRSSSIPDICLPHYFFAYTSSSIPDGSSNRLYLAIDRVLWVDYTPSYITPRV